jgi:hypothetical protein
MVDRAEITLPNSSKPKLMLTLSLKATPVAPVFLILSDPARSTKKNFAVVDPPSYPSPPISYN